MGVARLDIGMMTRATVSITDDDGVLVKFVRTEVEIDEDSPAHSANICVVMEGQIRRAVSVTVASHPGTAGGMCVCLFSHLLSCIHSKFVLFS